MHYAVFCPNIADSSQANTPDQNNLMVTVDDQEAQSKANEETWLQLQSGPSNVTLPRTAMFTCINHALHWITSGRGHSLPLLHDKMEISPHVPPPDKAAHIQLLVTGSLYLVGTVMDVMGYIGDDV